MNDISELFVQAKSRLDLREVCERYGVQFSRAGFARCPFHSERTGSFTVRRSKSGGQYYRCFGCGAYGDVFQFVGEYCGISDRVGQLRRLNDDFALGLDLDRRQTRAERAETERRRQARQREQALQRAFAEWCDRSSVAVCAYVRTLRRWAAEYQPTCGDTSPLYEYAMQHKSRAEYLADIFIEGESGRLYEAYIMLREEVQDIERFISGYQAERGAAGGA